MSCALSGINISLITYADDICSLSRTLDKICETFQKLQTEYLKSGVELNTEKFNLVLSNYKDPLPDVIVLGNSKTLLSNQIVCLVIPIGNTVSYARHVLT